MNKILKKSTIATGIIGSATVICCLTSIPVHAESIATTSPHYKITQPVVKQLEENSGSDPATDVEMDEPSCRPSPNHPRPVLLLHGTGGNKSDWNVLAPQLRGEGYCVFAMNYGQSNFSAIGRLPHVYGTDDISNSSTQVSNYVEWILKTTGSSQIDIVGHSQGAVVARNYMRFHGGIDENPFNNKVRKLITLGGTNHGTTVDGLAHIIMDHPELSLPASQVFSQAALQQIVGSSFIRHLNESGDTDRGVDYTSIATKFDQVSTPPENTFLQAGPDSSVRNIFIQDINPNSKVTHKGLSADVDVIELVKKSLEDC